LIVKVVYRKRKKERKVFRGNSENTESQEGREKSPPEITCAYILINC
jgi:hypothetical protein